MKDLEIQIGDSGGLRKPLCPHCEREMHQINIHRGKMKAFVELQVLSCPNCRKVLEIQTLS
jgi:transposase-like protein